MRPSRMRNSSGTKRSVVVRLHNPPASGARPSRPSRPHARSHMATLLATIIARDQPRFSNSAILRRMIAKIKELSGRNRRGKLPRLKRDRYVWKYRCSLNREIKNKVLACLPFGYPTRTGHYFRLAIAPDLTIADQIQFS